MPDVPVEVVGGPSSVGVMALQASLGAESDGLSGRFEGFSSLTTGNFEENSLELRNIKMQEFSINFINAKKLKKRLLHLEQAFSGGHKILLANELTKKYERRYYGTIAGLIEKMGNEPDF
jgi:16S rRNA C1402 (ribose-2'-O) methylase RsmI